MKKRKFFSLFAILFVAVFALSCCFLFACNKDDSTEPEDTGTTQDPGTTEDPGTTDPGTTDPGTTDPGTTDPGTTDPGTTDPGTTAIDSRIVLTTGEVELNDDSGVTYANPDSETLYIAKTTADDAGNVTYTLAGTASTMSADQANDFWADHAAAGDAYVIITVSFEEDETVSWTASNGETRERTVEDYEDGEMDVIIRISGNDLSTEIENGTATYTITDSESGAVTHTVDFSEVVKTQDSDEETQIKGFTVPVAGGEEALSSQSFSVDETTQVATIEDNDYFTLTATETMSYSGGTWKETIDGNETSHSYGALQVSGHVVSFVDMAGNTINPDQGIKMSQNIIPSGGTKSGDNDHELRAENVISLTAKANIHIRIYVSYANDSYNSDRAGTISYTLDGTTTSLEAVTARTQVRIVEIDLSAGQAVTVSAENTETDTGHNAKLWLFGAEAILQSAEV